MAKGDVNISSHVVKVGNKKRADVSRAVEDSDAFYMDSRGADSIIPTPYSLQGLSQAVERSNMLPQCIDCMKTNIAGRGYRRIPRNRGVPIMKKEDDALSAFIEYANSEESLKTVQSKAVVYYEKYGYTFYEVIRNRKGDATLLRSLSPASIRMTKTQPEPIPVTVAVTRRGRTTRVTELRRFRKYIQQVGTHKIFFKEFGDPRPMSYITGEYQDKNKGGSIPAEELATELLHHGQVSENPYGVPRWVSQLPSIYGSRESEEVNLRYFEDNTVPPMLLTVAGGRLTRSSFMELKDLLSRQGVGKERQNQILLLEAVPESTDLDGGSGSVKLQIEKLTDVRQSDGLFKDYDDSNMGKIRSAFRIPPVLLGQSQEVNFACYDEQTETLTDSGWVRLDQWQEGMKIACYDEKTRAIEFHDPETGILIYEVKDLEMYRVLSTQQDMLVTPNHRMLSATKKEGEYIVETIEEVADRSRSYFRTAGLYRNGQEEDLLDYFDVPISEYHGGIAARDKDIASIPSSLFLEWLGYFLADGCITQKGCAIKIGAKKERKVLAFASLHEELEEYGFRVRVSEEKAGTYYTVSHKGMAQFFAEVAGDCSETKIIPNMAFGYSATDLRTLFDAMMFCDGTLDKRAGRTSGSYSTVSLALADSFQRLAVLLGYRTSLRKDRPGQYGVNPVYLVMLSKKETCQILTKQHITTEQYTGRVYCFSVPTGVFITRRNGKVAFQGNTANVSAYLAETQVFQPERSIHDEFLNKNFINHPKGLGLKTVKLESRGPAITNPTEVVKSMTALNVMGAITPRKAVDMANESLLLDIDNYPAIGDELYEEWMDTPMLLAQRMVANKTQQTGEGNGTHDASKVTDNSTKNTQQSGQVEPQPVEHGQE